MQRYEVVQELLRMFPAPSYLEIGVDAGDTFRALEATNKVAVDPAFKFVVPANLPGNREAYHQVTSDEYFAVAGGRSKFEVVYIDGLHTFEQVLRDILNATENLAPFGVIVVDDVTPNSYHSGLPSLTEAFAVRDFVANWHPELSNDATWMGDVYKSVFFVKSFMQSWDFATVAENHGQMLMWRRPREPEELGGLSVQQVAALEFKDTVRYRNTFNSMPFADIVSCIRSQPGFLSVRSAL